MKINQIIINEMTAGSVASVAMPIGEVNKRTNETVKTRGLEPAEKIISGRAKKKGPYANSLSEAKKDFAAKLAGKIAKSNKDKKNTEEKVKQNQEQQKNKVEEAKLDEDDLIIVPGKGLNRRSGFIPHDPDKAEHEGQTLKNSLHTIIRVATHLNKELSTQDNFPEWVSEKIGAVKHMMVTVMDYLISDKEMNGRITPNEMTGGVIAAGGVGEGVAEMDNRTPQGDRREQRANSPEEKAKREKEFQDNLKKAGPKLRKKLRLPEPKDEGVAEGSVGDDRGDYHSTAKAANQASRTAKSRKDHAKAADLHNRAATYGLSAGQDQSVIYYHQMAAREHYSASKGLKEQGVAAEKVNEKFASQQQAKLMYAVAGDPKVAKKTGVSQSVAKEFIKKSHGQKVGQLPKKAKKG